MVYETVEQLFSHIEKIREKLIQSVSNLSDEQAASRRAPEAWTIAEIVEHLSITEKSLLRVVNKLLEKAESEGIKLETKGVFNPPLSLAAEAEKAKDIKVQAPDFLIPNNAASITASLDSLSQSRAALNELRDRIETVDSSNMKFPHPAFGPINLCQWVAFIGMREAHHLRQIKETFEKTAEAKA